MRRITLASLLASLLLVSALAPSLAAPPPEHISPAGQINVVTVNAKQVRVLGLKRFLAMFELGRALRFRPPGFDGGVRGEIIAPDVLIIQEMRTSNLEIFERLLRQRFPYKYQVAGAPDASANFIVNTNTVTPVGEPVRWADVCTDPNNPPDGRAVRDYQFLRFTENATGAPFVVAGMHLAKNYTMTGQERCLERNMQEMRRQLASETAPVVIGGDFNRRPVETLHECDPNETSAPLEWWLELTAPTDGGRAYEDAVLSWHRAHNESMESEWTHEQKSATPTCNGQSRFRRSRIDYLFSAGAVIADAHADHPGWAGVLPGRRHPVNYKYSDHRFVWGRFGVAGPPAPSKPSVTKQAGGLMDLSWAPVEGATGYLVLRAIGSRYYDYLTQTDAATTTYTDFATEHGQLYRYAIAAVGADGSQGIESRGSRSRADARGPQVRAHFPTRDAPSVDLRATVRVWFAEEIDPTSVTSNTIELRLDGNRVRGRVEQAGNASVTFDPTFPLRYGKRYQVVVRGVRDELGNRGEWYRWGFTTEPRPKRRKG